MRALGLDIGGSSVKATVLDPETHVVPVGMSDRYARPSRGELATALRQAARSVSTDPSAIGCVGVCVPGRRDPSGSTVLACVNLPGLIGQRVDDVIHEAIGPGARVMAITSDAHAAAFDLAHRLPRPTPAGDEPPPRLLALSLGTGVGACVLDDLTPLLVSGLSPGHLGQIDVGVALAEGSIPVAPDGGRGGLEGYIGLPALLARLGPPAHTLIDRLLPDDPALVSLSRAIRICHAIYRPHTVALLGGVGVRLRRFQDHLFAMVSDELTSIARSDWRLMFGDDDYHAARGVARLALAKAT